MRSVGARACALTAAVAAIVTSLSMCQSPTQITLVVYTDVDCKTGPNHAVTIGHIVEIEDRLTSSTSSQCDPATGRVASLVVVPSGPKNETIAIKVVQAVGKSAELCKKPDYDGCIVSRRALRFIPQSGLDLPVWMRTSCIGKPCDAYTTCVKGVCVSATIDDPSQCHGTGCDESSLVANNDGGAPDASIDGARDGSSSDGGIGDATVCTDCLGPVSAGGGASCTIVEAGSTAVCWGANGSNELGRGGSSGPDVPGPVVSGTGDLREVVGLVGKHDATCARRDGGDTLCWGQNDAFELLTDASIGLGTLPRATVVNDLIGSVEIAIGSEHLCWRRDAQHLYCYGHNPFGQLGVPDAGSAIVDVPLGGGDVQQVSAGDISTCIVSSDKRVRCFGDNVTGESDPRSPSPIVGASVVDLGGLAAPIAVVVGFTHACALLADNTVACWGGDGSGATGQGAANAMPALVNGPGATPLRNVVQLSLGQSHTCARDASGTVFCWGDNAFGQLGHVAMSPQLSAVAVPGLLSPASYVSTGTSHSCASLVNKQVWCWGKNDTGQLGPATDAGQSFAVVRVY